MKTFATLLAAIAVPALVNAADPLYVPRAGYAYADPPAPHLQPLPEVTPPVPVAPHTVGVYPVASAPVVGQVVELYPHVRVVSPQHAHPCAVTEVVQVPNPRPRDGCCEPVFVEICVPPGCPPQVTYGPLGQRVTYSFGGYRVKVTSLRGVVTVDYDRRLLQL